MSRVKRITHRLNPKERTPKVALLYILLIPMFISVVISLFRGDFNGFTLKIVGFALLYGSTYMAKNGLLAKHKYDKSILTKAPKIPYLKMAAIGLGITSFYLSFMVGGRGFLASLFVGILAPIGSYLYYGFDPTKDKIDSIDGISADLVLSTISDANEKLDYIQNNAQKVNDYKLRGKIDKALKKSRTILQTLQEDPKDIRVARKFLIVYIDGVKNVVDSYIKLDAKDIDQPTKDRLYGLMDNVEERFDKELARLKSNNKFDLDVHIDTLKEQIKH